MFTFSAQDVFPYPVGEAYLATSRDFAPLVDYIPNLSKIETLEYEKINEYQERYLLRFHADAVVPRFARGIFRPEWLRWNQTMLCDSRVPVVEWNVITDHFTEDIYCRGANHYYPADGGTTVEIKGDFEITVKQLAGVPDFIVKRVVPIIETFIGKLIVPNNMEFYAAVKERMAVRPVIPES